MREREREREKEKEKYRSFIEMRIELYSRDRCFKQFQMIPSKYREIIILSFFYF